MPREIKHTFKPALKTALKGIFVYSQLLPSIASIPSTLFGKVISVDPFGACVRECESACVRECVCVRARARARVCVCVCVVVVVVVLVVVVVVVVVFPYNTLCKLFW